MPTTRHPPLDPAVASLPVITLFENEGPEVRPMVLRPIPPGRGLIGNRGGPIEEEPRHWVEFHAPTDAHGQSIPNLPAFWMQETPVTQGQLRLWTNSTDYAAWLAENSQLLVERDRRPHRNSFGSGDPEFSHHPAENVSWFEASAFCRWLLSHLTPGKSVGVPALPTESEWEYACRARTTTDYYTGDGTAALDEAGWFDGNSKRTTHPVAEKVPNRWGLFDLHGNVWEWCSDAWRGSPYRGDPSGGGGSPPDRVVRGGSWNYSPEFCRSAIRNWWRPEDRNWLQGFRVCLLPGPVVKTGENQKNKPEAESPRPRGGDGGGTTTERPSVRGDGQAPPDLSLFTLPSRPADGEP